LDADATESANLASAFVFPSPARPDLPNRHQHPIPAGVADRPRGQLFQETVEEALGADLADAIPDLLRLSNLEVRIPCLEILALESLAEHDGQIRRRHPLPASCSTSSPHSDYLAAAIPGFTAGRRWPQ